MEWRLTDQELEQIKLHHSGSLLDAVEKAQKAKRQAYIEAGGVILNPEALSDMYEALTAMYKSWVVRPDDEVNVLIYKMAGQAIAKAEGK